MRLDEYFVQLFSFWIHLSMKFKHLSKAYTCMFFFLLEIVFSDVVFTMLINDKRHFNIYQQGK